MEIGLYDSYLISLFPFNRTVDNVIEFSIKSIVCAGGVPCIVHQHPISGRERVDKCGFPRSGSGRRVYDHWLFRLGNLLNNFQYLKTQAVELRTPVVDCRTFDGAQNPVRYIGWSGNL